MAVLGKYTNQTTAPPSCLDSPNYTLTLSEVTGRGLCIGAVPTTHQTLCKVTIRAPTGNYYLAAPYGTYWACNTGLTLCISAIVLNQISDYCVLTEIWPKIIYHDPESVYSYFEGQPRVKREPLTLTLALLIGGITF